MKHVFGASSHLVFYLCNRIIELDHINPDDCIFFFTRNYHCPPKYDKIYKNIIDTGYNVDEKKGRVFEGIHLLKTRHNIKEFDTMVDSYLRGDDFIWYSQVCSNDFCSLFVFEVKNHFITTDHPKFKGCIATTEYCFPLHQQYLRCVGLPFETIDLGFSPDAIISIDPIYLFVNEQAEDCVYQRLSHYILNKNYSHIAYKFHPYFFAKSNADIKKRFESLIKKYYGDSLTELSADVSLENVLMTYHSDFYTDNSSVAVYGNAMNVKCYTYIPILRNYTTAYNSVPLIEQFCTPIE